MKDFLGRLALRKQRFFSLLKTYALACSEKIGASRLKPSGNNVVVSLTTYPARLGTVYITIETILNQVVKPDRLILWLSEDEIRPEDLPPQLLRQQRRGLEIRFVPDNLRSYKKLVYAAKEHTGKIIITIDDDIIYPRYWLQDLLGAHAESPRSIICYRGSYIEYDASGNRQPYPTWSHRKGEDKESVCLFPIGVSGILYPPGSIDLELLDADLFMSLCPTGDDIWFRSMTLHHGWPCRRVYKESIHFPIVPGTQETSLHRINNLENKNQAQIENAFKYFSLDEKLRENLRMEFAEPEAGIVVTARS